MRGRMAILAAALGTVALFAASASAYQRAVPKPKDSGFAQVDGISLFYQVYGQGSPLLLIPGGLSDADVWRKQIPVLSKNHKVIVADSRGQGRSTRDDEPITYELMADDYLALLDALKVDKVALVGWSDGGIIGLDIALRHPERLSRMFIQAANATPDGALAYAALVAAGDLPALRHYDDVTQEIHALWANEPNFTEEDLASITVPTMVAIGEHDEAISLEHTIFLADTIPGAKLTILPNVGHSAPIEDPAGYAKAVLDFVDDPNGSAPEADDDRAAPFSTIVAGPAPQKTPG